MPMIRSKQTKSNTFMFEMCRAAGTYRTMMKANWNTLEKIAAQPLIHRTLQELIKQVAWWDMLICDGPDIGKRTLIPACFCACGGRCIRGVVCWPHPWRQTHCTIVGAPSSEIERVLWWILHYRNQRTMPLHFISLNSSSTTWPFIWPSGQHTLHLSLSSSSHHSTNKESSTKLRMQ
jgi:hypothetical protein